MDFGLIYMQMVGLSKLIDIYLCLHFHSSMPVEGLNTQSYLVSMYQETINVSMRKNFLAANQIPYHFEYKIL